jgi:N-glycosylase/DNA lyase
MSLAHLSSDLAETRHSIFPVAHYDLDSTLASGQAFRWRRVQDAWEGVIGPRWVRLRSDAGVIRAETAEPVSHWDWLRSYLQLEVDLDAVFATFPQDAFLQQAVQACQGLRLLKQDPWECLASFILSSTKQICQIEQIIDALCVRFGSPLAVPAGHSPAWRFPDAHRLARASEAEMRACKMGFRAPNLLVTARMVDQQTIDLEALAGSTYEEAQRQLMMLPGVGDKIANCVLLFCGFYPEAFPIDVWIKRVLQDQYFPKQHCTANQLQQFGRTHFGPRAGYAQQYLFHYARVIQAEGARQSAPR